MRHTRTTAAILSGLCLLGAAMVSAVPAHAAASTAEGSKIGAAGAMADFRMYNRGSGRCLMNSGGSISGTFTGSCTTGANRYWYGVDDIGGGRIVNRGTGRCLTASTTSVWTAPCDGSTVQVWTRAGYGLVRNSGNGYCMYGVTQGGGVGMARCDQGNLYHQWPTL